MKTGNKKSKVLRYLVDLFLLAIGISFLITKLLNPNIENLFFWLLVISTMFFLLFFDLFKPLGTPEQYVKRAAKYRDRFDNKAKAMELYKQAIDLNIKNDEKRIDTLLDLGVLYLEENQLEVAESYFQTALSDQKDEKLKGDLYFRIGGAYSDHGLYSKATTYIDQALNIGLKYIGEIRIYSPALIQLIQTYILDHQEEKAHQIYRQLLEKKVIKKNKKVEALLLQKK